jgi:hypothetical protein
MLSFRRERAAGPSSMTGARHAVLAKVLLKNCFAHSKQFKMCRNLIQGGHYGIV